MVSPLPLAVSTEPRLKVSVVLVVGVKTDSLNGGDALVVVAAANEGKGVTDWPGCEDRRRAKCERGEVHGVGDEGELGVVKRT